MNMGLVADMALNLQHTLVHSLFHSLYEDDQSLFLPQVCLHWFYYRGDKHHVYFSLNRLLTLYFKALIKFCITAYLHSEVTIVAELLAQICYF